MSKPEIEGWSEYRKLILNELERLGEMVSAVDKKLDRLTTDELSKLKVELAMLKTKAAMLGAAAGTVPVIVDIVLQVLRK